MTVSASDVQGRYTGDRSKFGPTQPGGQSAAIRNGPTKEAGGRCGSCLKAAGQVRAMFEAPTAFICNECVMLFIEEVAKRRESG